MSRWVGPIALAVLGIAAGIPHSAAAFEPPDDGEAAPVVRGPILLSATPAFGQDASTGGGWSEVVAQVENVGAEPIKGTIELAEETYGGYRAGLGSKTTVRVPFHVPAGQRVVVHVPTPAFASYAGLRLTALNDAGKRLADVPVRSGDLVNPMLVDVHQPSRLAVVMRDWPIALAWDPSGGYSTSARSLQLKIGVPTYDRTTGEPVLPERVAAYGGATAVLVSSDTFARLEAPARDALVAWMYGGGTLAVIPTRPEDLRTGPLAALAGGPIETAPVPPSLLTLPSVKRPAGSFGGNEPSDPEPPSDQAPLPDGGTDNEVPPSDGGASTGPVPPTDAGKKVTPIRYVPVSTSAARGHGPSPALRERLHGYVGGDLAPSPFGASVRRGLGELHVLAFDPTVSPGVDDGWVHGRILAMIERAWDRRARVVFAAGERDTANDVEVRRLLDPNESFRPTLAIAAVLLVIYSFVSGPIVFSRAKKKGRPLDPLVWAPACAAVAFGAIVLVGFVSKGWRGRARRVALVELGAGAPQGIVQRYRSFYSSHTRALDVPASDPGCVLDVTGEIGADRGKAATLRLDREGGTLEGVTSLTWQTVLVSEKGTLALSRGVSVTKGGGGDVDVTNHTGRTLRDVLVHVPGADLVYFEGVKDGETVHAKAGRRLSAPTHATSPFRAGMRYVNPLGIEFYGTALGAAASGRMLAPWTAFERAGGMAVDWRPLDEPVVLAEIEGGAQVKTDSGLDVESDRLFLRVVGYGGEP